MSWILWAVIALVGLVAAMALVGTQLEMGHVAASRARYRADIERVWKAVEAAIAEQEMKLEVVEREPPRRLVTRIPPGGPFGGTWTCELEPGEGATLTITERGEVYNVLFRFLSRFVFGHHGTQESFLKAVGRKLDEAIAPERVGAP
jgi:hypothetical protein